MSIDRQKVIDSAQKFAAKGQFDKAIVEYMRLVKDDPTDVRVLLKIGDLQVRNGARDDAIATYSRVARGYDEQGYFLKAIAVYKQILSIDPNLTELYSRLADLYVKLGLVPDALAHLDALATRYVRAGQDDKLVAIYRQMCQVDPANVPCHIKLAELLSRLGRHEEAAREFEAGALLLREAGRLDDWAKVAERLLFHRPTDQALAKELARHHLERQDAKRALPKLQVCFKANPKDIDTLEMLAAAFQELQQLPKTISVLKEIARIHGENGAQDKRLETCRRVLELAPNDAEAKDVLRSASRLAPKPAPAPAPAPAPPAPVAAPPPPAVEEDEVEEVVLVDDDEAEPVYELAAAPARVPPPPPPPPRGAPPPPAPDTAPILLEPRRAPAPPPRPPAPVVAPVPAPAAPDNSAEVARVVGEADIFLKYGLKPKAAQHLHRALELDPDSIDVHVRLRDLYAELGDLPGTVRHSVRLAEIVAPTDPVSALAELARVLEIDPSHAEAYALYQQLQSAVAPPPEEQYAADAYAADAYGQGGDAAPEMPVAPVAGRDLEEGLDEAEFFVSQGLYDEARETLQQLYAQYPGHPLVLERFEELEALLQAQVAPADDQSFALAEKLAEEVDNVAQGGDPHFNAGGEMIDVETVFAQFKKGVEKTVSADDADTHYDLGIAYKEMGLIDDAISEFNIAAHSSRKAFMSETMIGMCHMERGDVATAIEHFKRALQAPTKSDREEMGLYFEVGNACEVMGDLSEALQYFLKVEKRDPTFRGVRQRVQRLSAQLQPAPSRSRIPQNAEMDEVDRAFDDLFKG